MKKRLTSISFYMVSLIVFFCPWMAVGAQHYNPVQFAILLKENGIERILEQAQLGVENADIYNIIIKIELAVWAIFLLLSLFYIICVFTGKKWKTNVAVLLWTVVAAYFHFFSYGIRDLSPFDFINVGVPFFLVFIVGAECLTRAIMERWKELAETNRVIAERDKREKEEKKHRLYFKGHYTKLFYQLVWKNFRKNGKDYLLLLICNLIVFSFMTAGLGMKRLLSLEREAESMNAFEGLNEILMSVMFPMGIVSVFIIVILLFYYLKCRAKNYGVFLTLGMRRKTLYYFAGLEFASVFLISVLSGGLIGTGVLLAFTQNSQEILGIEISFLEVGWTPYLQSAGILFLIYLVSFMATRDIFVVGV